MRISTFVAAFVVATPLFLSVDAAQQTPASPPDARLPVKRVVLYKSGIGWTAAPLTGRLLSVERQDRRVDGMSTPVDILSLVTDAGDLHTVALDTGVTVRILDADLNAEVATYLAVIGSERAA